MDALNVYKTLRLGRAMPSLPRSFSLIGIIMSAPAVFQGLSWIGMIRPQRRCMLLVWLGGGGRMGRSIYRIELGRLGNWLGGPPDRKTDDQ